MKKTTRILLSLALSAQMIFSLTSCGSKKTDGSDIAQNDTNTSYDSDSAGNKSESGRIVSESDPYYNVTISAMKPSIPQDKKVQYSDIANHYIVGDRIIADIIVSYEMPEDVLNHLFSLDLDNEQDLKEYDRIEEEYNYSALLMFDLNGEVVAEIEHEPDCSFVGAYPGKDGEILILSTKVDMQICRSAPRASVISASGEKLRDIDFQIDEPIEDIGIYALENGNILLTSIGKFWILDSEGKVLFEIEDPTLNHKVLHSGGKWYAVMPTYGSGDTELYIQEIDTENGKLTGMPFKGTNEINWLTQGEQDCFLLNANGIEKFDVATQTKTRVLEWKDTDVNSSTLNLQGVRIASEDDMVFFQFNAIDDAGRGAMDLKSQGASLVNIVHLSKADKNPHAGKTILRLGVDGGISATFLEQVLEYNKDPQNKARIEIIDYTADTVESQSYDDEKLEEGLMESKKQLIMDMLSGNSPDILVGYSELSQFNSDTMLVDLNPLIDSDGSFHRDEIYDNILRSFEEGGKLYTIPLTYTLEGIAVNSNYNGAKENWTFSDFDQMASSLSPDVQPIASVGPDYLLKLWMQSLSPHFVDNQNKSVDFESEEFRTLLETVKKHCANHAFGSPTSAVMDDSGDWINDDHLFQDNLVASCYVTLRDLQNYAYIGREKGGRKVVFTGVPSLSGMSMTAKGDLSMGISSSCADPELAWSFISYFLNEDAQQALSFNTDTLPINKNAFHTNCQIEIDINKEEGEDIKNSSGMISPEVIEDFVELTKELEDAMDALISGVSSAQAWDNDIMSIIQEESAGFFAGQRTVDDVCKNIQKRATLVVQER